MSSQKLFLYIAVVTVVTCNVAAELIDLVYNRVMREKYNFAPHSQTYRFEVEEMNGNHREEMGLVLNPGTDDEELVIIGVNTQTDAENKNEQSSLYTVDRTGYQTHPLKKQSWLSQSPLASRL